MKTKSRKRGSHTRIREADKLPGKVLDIFRKDLGLTQQNIGELLGCSFQQAGKYLRGTNRLSPALILTCADRFTISPAAFFREAESAEEIEDLLNRAELEYQLYEIQEALTIEEINRLIDIAKIVFDLNYGPGKE